MTRVLVHGASGRMGQAICRLARESDRFFISAEVDADSVHSLDAALDETDVVVDFSSPAGLRGLLSALTGRAPALVVGTTGFDQNVDAALHAEAEARALVVAPNTSVGVTVLFHLAEEATRLLGDGWDAEIVEMHHRHKVDAPSGTALRLADSVLSARGWTREQIRDARSGAVGPRPDAEVGVMTLRGGDVVGEHTLTLAAEGERLELVHRATHRDIFARGALRAAEWVSAQPMGRYDMFDVLGIPRAKSAAT